MPAGYRLDQWLPGLMPEKPAGPDESENQAENAYDYGKANKENDAGGTGEELQHGIPPVLWSTYTDWH
jgi:hypothetical protein|nr:hypothetical protein [Pseudomonas sp.]